MIISISKYFMHLFIDLYFSTYFNPLIMTMTYAAPPLPPIITSPAAKPVVVSHFLTYTFSSVSRNTPEAL